MTTSLKFLAIDPKSIQSVEVLREELEALKRSKLLRMKQRKMLDEDISNIDHDMRMLGQLSGFKIMTPIYEYAVDVRKAENPTVFSIMAFGTEYIRVHRKCTNWAALKEAEREFGVSLTGSFANEVDSSPCYYRVKEKPEATGGVLVEEGGGTCLLKRDVWVTDEQWKTLKTGDVTELLNNRMI